MSIAGDIGNQLLSTVARLAALETRTQDVARHQELIEAKLDSLLERLIRIEGNYEHLRSGVRNEIMADIKADLRETRVYLDLQARGIPFGASVRTNIPGDGDPNH